MEKWRKHLPPEQMTSEEREERIMELLVLASIRMASEQQNKKDGAPVDSIISAAPIPMYPKRGPVPFGYSWVDGKIIINNEEMKWIHRIKELDSEGLSSEKIAARLHQEDHTSRRAGKWTHVAVWRILKRGE